MNRFKTSIAARKGGVVGGPSPARAHTDLAIDLEDEEEERKSEEAEP